MPITINGTTGISGENGSAATPAFQGNDTNTGVFFPAADTVAVSTNGSERVRVDSSGNVGIGTGSPGYSLEINRAGGSFRVRDAAAGNDVVIQTATGPISLIGSTANTAIGFTTNNLERARIDTSGNLLVGTTSLIGSVTDKLQVNEATTRAGLFRNAVATIDTLGVWNSATTGNNLFCQFYTEAGASMRGSIDFNRGAGQVRYNITSDATLKNIIGDSDGQKSAEILNSTRIREYAWKDDEQQKPQIGVIAQELYETYKGAVSVGGEVEKTDAEGNVTTEYRPWGVDKTAFTFHLIAGWQMHEKMIQEQQAMIEELRTEIAALKGQE